MRPAAPAVCPQAVLVRSIGPHAWWVRLPNGHELAGIVRRADRAVAVGLAAGETVTIEIMPADFSRGRLRLSSDATPHPGALSPSSARKPPSPSGHGAPEGPHPP